MKFPLRLCLPRLLLLSSVFVVGCNDSKPTPEGSVALPAKASSPLPPNASAPEKSQARPLDPNENKSLEVDATRAQTGQQKEPAPLQDPVRAPDSVKAPPSNKEPTTEPTIVAKDEPAEPVTKKGDPEPKEGAPPEPPTGNSRPPGMPPMGAPQPTGDSPPPRGPAEPSEKSADAPTAPEPKATSNAGKVSQVAAIAPAAKPAAAKSKFDPTAEAQKQIAAMKVKPGDWPQWFGSSARNNTPPGKNIPVKWDAVEGTNIKYSVILGSQTYGNPTVANGKVYVGTNNGGGYMKRYPARFDLGALICIEEATGKFLWQHSSEKLTGSGRVNDWPLQGICCSPYCEGDRLWFTSSRGEIICLDAEGFLDKENDGPFKDEKPMKDADKWEEEKEADVIWKLDMMRALGVFQHNMCNCSITAAGDRLFVITSNGVDDAHASLPAPSAPSFLCIDKNSGEVLWTDNSPGENVLHGQWSSPAYGVFNGQAQAIFCGGDGYVYSFDPAGSNGKSKLLWKFDTNPKKSIYTLQRATRNHLIGTPVIYDGLIYIAVGEDVEHGEGEGHLWCINPVNKGGDVSPTQVFNKKDPSKPIAHKRLQACVEADGDFEKDNPNTAAVWHYQGMNPGGGAFEDDMHRTMGTVAIKNDLLFVADFTGLFHCVDAKTGKNYWAKDLLSASWASPLIVDNKVYISDEDGDIEIFELSKELKPLQKQQMPSSVYTSPVVANNTLFIADKSVLYAIVEGAKSQPVKGKAAEGGDGE